MKAQILKIAGVKSEKDFYKKFPTEEAFMAKHGGEFKKAMLGAKMTTAQNGLTGLPDDPPFQNPDPTQFNLMGDPSIPRQYERIQPMQMRTPSIPVPALQNAKLAPNNHPTKSNLLGKLKENVDLPGKIAGGIQAIRQEKEDRMKAERWRDVSEITLAASQSQDVNANQIIHDNMTKKREMMMPVNTGEEFFPIYGVGTNPLAKDGKKIAKGKKSKGEIMNVASPEMPIAINGLNTFLGAGGGDMIGNATNWAYGENAGSKLGGDLGGAVGGIFGPVGGFVGKEVGKLAGWAFDRNPAKTKAAQGVMNQNMQMMGINNGMQGVQGQYTSYMEDGGYVSNNWTPQVITKFGEHKLSDLLRRDPMMDTLRTGGSLRQNETMGGDLQTHWGGHAEPISYNPYLPEGGQMVEFRGNSHEESVGNGKTGIGITFGNSPVEVEDGEPAVKLADGGSADPNLTVFGRLPIGREGAAVLGTKGNGNMSYKAAGNHIAKLTNKANKQVEEAIKKIDELGAVNDSYEKIKLAALKAEIEGGNMKLKNYAGVTQFLADKQERDNFLKDNTAKNGKMLPLTTGEPDRKSWDIPGRVMDWAGEKLGEAYQQYVPEGVQNVIEPIGEAVSRVNAWPFTPEYREEHPLNYGVAPAVGLAGKAAKAAKVAKPSLKSVVQDVEVTADRAKQIAKDRASWIDKKKLSKITREDLKNPDTYDNLSQAEIEYLNRRLPGSTSSAVDELEGFGKSSQEVKKIDKAFEKAYADEKYQRVKDVARTKPTTATPSKPAVVSNEEAGSIWPSVIVGTGVAGAAGGLAYAGLSGDDTVKKVKPVSKPVVQPRQSPQTIEQLNKINPAAKGSSQMNPLYNAMQKNYEQGGNIAQDGRKEPWRTIPVYLPWPPDQGEFRIPGGTSAGKMTPEQVQNEIRNNQKATGKRRSAAALPEIAPQIDLTPYQQADLSGMVPTNIVNKPYAESYASNSNPDDDKYWWINAMNSMVPYFRPSDAEQLDPRQLGAEMYVMSTNKREPVQAQTYRPGLRTPYDISFQDQLNEIHAQTRAAQRMAGYNPAAQAAIAAQAYAPESGVLANQFRANQQMRDQVYGQNLQTLNDAQLKNLGIYDQQYQRQEAAKSATKLTNIEALKSIADKYMKNQAEQRTLQTYENLYGYRFGPRMQAWNWNQPAQFNIPTVGVDARATALGVIRNANGEELLPIYGKDGQPTGYKVKEDTTPARSKTSKSGRNGTIVRDWKNL